MATTESAEAILQRQAMEKLQGTNAVIGGKGEVIQVTQEQSEKIMQSLTGITAEIAKKDPATLTEAERQLLAMVGSVGPKGKMNGQQACQSLLIIHKMKKVLDGNKKRSGTENRQRQAFIEAGSEIAKNVIPAKVAGAGKIDRFCWWAKEHVGAKHARIEGHPIIVAYEQKLVECQTAWHTGDPDPEVTAMAESIKLYGVSEVDKLMKQVEAQKAAEMRGEQRRDAHVKKEKLQGELDQEKPQYDSDVKEKADLVTEKTQLTENRRELQSQIADLQVEIDALPHDTSDADLTRLQQEYTDAKKDSTISKTKVEALKAKKDFVLKKLQYAEGKAKSDLYDGEITRLREEMKARRLEQQKAEAEAQGAKQEAADLNKQAKEARTRGDNRRAGQLEVMARTRGADSAAQEAIADSYGPIISDLDKTIKDALALKGKVTPDVIDIIQADITTITDDIARAEGNRTEADITAQQKEDELTDRKDARKTKDQKTLAQEKFNNQVIRIDSRISTDINPEITRLDGEIDAHEAKQRELTGVEACLQALGKAEQAAEYLAENGTGTKTEICTALGIDPARFYDNQYIRAVNEVCGSACLNIGDAEAELVKRKGKMNFWKVIQAAVGGARIV